MKVAVCLSGLTRSLGWSWLFINRYLVQPYNADVYLHSWNDLDNGGARAVHLYKSGHRPSIVDGRSKEQFINEDIKPVTHILESFDLWSKNNRNDNTSAMYYGVHQAINLAIESGNTYDIIMRVRMDCFFQTFINQSELNDCLTNNVLYCALPGKKWDRNIPTDIFGFGNLHVMRAYSNTIIEQSIGGGMPEEVLYNQIRKYNIDHKWSTVEYMISNEWSLHTVTLWGDFG